MTLTSRKHGKKNRSRFLISIFFDHPDLQSLKDCIFVLFWSYDRNFEIMGACYTPLERCFQDFSKRYIKSPHILKISVGKPKKQIYIRLVAADKGGQKNYSGKTIAVLFYHVFY